MKYKLYFYRNYLRDGYNGAAINSIITAFAPPLASISIGASYFFNGMMFDNLYEEARNSGASYEITDTYQPMEGSANGHTYSIRKC